MDFTQFYIGRDIEIQYKVMSADKKEFLNWYGGIITGLGLTGVSKLSLNVTFSSTSDFDECTESFYTSSQDCLQQASKSYPFRFKDSAELRAFTPHTSEVSRLPVSHKDVEEKDLHLRLSRLEAILRSSSNQMYIYICSLLNNSLRKYMARVKKPVDRGNQLVQSTWSLSIDCSLSIFKNFMDYADETIGNRCPSRDDYTKVEHSDLTITFQTVRDFADFFGMSEVDKSKLLVVKRCDRQGKLLSFKGLGSLIHNEQPNFPMLFCLGGSASKWSDHCSFYFRDNCHKEQGGLHSAPFTRIRSQSQHEALLQRSDSTDILSCLTLVMKWHSINTGIICSAGMNESMIVGKLEVHIPYVTFNDMTTASIVNSSIVHSINGGDSSSSDW